MIKFQIEKFITKLAGQRRSLNKIYGVKETLYINTYFVADMFGTSERTVREVLAKLNHEGKIRNFPARTKKGTYAIYDESIEEHRECYAKEKEKVYKAWKTMYFNQVVKALPHIKNEKMIRELHQLRLILEEGEL